MVRESAGAGGRGRGRELTPALALVVIVRGAAGGGDGGGGVRLAGYRRRTVAPGRVALVRRADPDVTFSHDRGSWTVAAMGCGLVPGATMPIVGPCSRWARVAGTWSGCGRGARRRRGCWCAAQSRRALPADRLQTSVSRLAAGASMWCPGPPWIGGLLLTWWLCRGSGGGSEAGPGGRSEAEAKAVAA